MIAQIIVLSLMFISLMLSSYQHGKPKVGNHNVLISILNVVLHLCLLYAGGFFDIFFK